MFVYCTSNILKTCLICCAELLPFAMSGYANHELESHIYSDYAV